MEREMRMRTEKNPPRSPPDTEAVQAVNPKNETQTRNAHPIQPKRLRFIGLLLIVEPQA
jgi:hypothetical protein